MELRLFSVFIILYSILVSSHRGLKLNNQHALVASNTPYPSTNYVKGNSYAYGG